MKSSSALARKKSVLRFKDRSEREKNGTYKLRLALLEPLFPPLRPPA